MATRRDPIVVDRDGVRATIRSVRMDSANHPVAVVELSDGRRSEVSFDTLQHHRDGGYAFPGSWGEVVRSSEGGVTLPVVAETVVTHIRRTPRESVRVRRRVVTEKRVVETPIWREHLDVEHVAIDRFVDRAPAPRQEGDTLIIPCVEEVVVVEKRLRLREELHVRVVRERAIDRQTVELRRQEIDIETTAPSRIPPPTKPQGGRS